MILIFIILIIIIIIENNTTTGHDISLYKIRITDWQIERMLYISHYMANTRLKPENSQKTQLQYKLKSTVFFYVLLLSIVFSALFINTDLF